MAQENLYHLNISDEDFLAVQQAVATLRNVLGPHLISLSAGSRREMPKMGPRTLDFVLKAQEYCSRNPALLPTFLSAELMDADLKAVERLRSLQRELQPLADNLDDSLLLAGSESYQAALVFYRSVKMAADSGQPDAKTIRDDLAARFPTGRRATVSAPAAVAVEG